jgi:hypothetical protein
MKGGMYGIKAIVQRATHPFCPHPPAREKPSYKV